MKIKKRIEVVYIVTQLELGGAQKVCLSLFHEIQKKGGTSYLISGTEGPLVKEVINNSHAILLPTLIRSVSLRSIVYELRTFVRLICVLQRLKKDAPDLIVHTHSTKAGIIGRWAAFFAGIKNRVHTIHGYGFHDYQSSIMWVIIYCIELITSLITTHFICVAVQDAKTGIRLFPGFKNKHSIIRAAVDARPFIHHVPLYHHESKNRPLIFGSIACFKPQKNIFDLLYAFKEVYSHNPAVRLEIIGDGILRPAIEDWIQANTLSLVITLHGWQEHVSLITQRWYAFVLSSLWEGLPCAIVEARLQKLPVIAYDTGGISEIILDQYNGLLYEKGNWKGLARGMQRIIHEPHLYYSLCSHTDNLRDFTLPAMIQDHLLLYKQLHSH